MVPFALGLMILAQISTGDVPTPTPPPLATEQETFTDPRDGTSYRTVRIGSQLWLGENVRFETEESWFYEDDPANLETYGRLYPWEGASCACPPDWHLPTAAEWETLFDHLGGQGVAGAAMKEAGLLHWQELNTDATNSSLFGGLPGGGRRAGADTYHALGMFGGFWSSTVQSDGGAWAFILGYHYPEVSVRASSPKSFGFSVRCVHD